MIVKALILSFLISTVSGKTEFEECLLDNSGFLLTKDICLPSNYKTIAVVNKVVKPIVRLSSLIELNKKFTSLSAIFNIYFIWKDDNLIANASSSNAVFFSIDFFFNRNKERSCKIRYKLWQNKIPICWFVGLENSLACIKCILQVLSRV